MSRMPTVSILRSTILSLGVAATSLAGMVGNPFIHADIPDISIVRAGDAYYMVHTTMHFAPGVPIMKSKDLAAWRLVGHAYQTLTNSDAMNLDGGKNAYGKGSWASSIRYRNGTFYVLTPSYTTGKTHLYSTKDPETGPWKEVLLPFYHDPSLFLDDDGRVYVVYGAGDIRIVELNADLSGVKSGGVSQLLFSNVASPTGGTSSLGEGSHVEKRNGYYYIFNICWPSGMPRTETVRRSKSITGPFEAQVSVKSSGGYDGVAQGSYVDLPDGSSMGYMFTDQGGVGRCPWLIPVTWKSDWPDFNGTVAPTSVSLAGAAAVAAGFGVVSSDQFSETKPRLEWQWNHNPDNAHWSLTERPGHYRITTSRLDAGITSAKNTLTHRSFGPVCSGRIALDASGLKDGDIAGLVALADSLGFVGIRNNGGALQIVKYYKDNLLETSVAIDQKRAFLRIDMNFKTNTATFFWSTDSSQWNSIGKSMHLPYTLGMFVGYRFGLFAYSTKSAGGHADFDWFKIGATANDEIDLYATNASLPGAKDQGGGGVFQASVREGALHLAFSLPHAGRVEAELYDASGRRLGSLLDRSFDLGGNSADLEFVRGQGRQFLTLRLDGTLIGAAPLFSP